ncbi:MAG TPA: hypothetical protein VHX66_10580 [Solirubrobacteraceae bacterium]|jgi:hypothetical protein|nr:hypothetical protein [Solirubrobacteraceae bacterium]
MVLADDALALGSFVVAAVATAIAFVTLAWSRSEHVEFLKRLRARARFEIVLTPVNALPAVDSEDPMAIMAGVGVPFEQLFQVGISNIGDGAAGPTTVNVVVPSSGPLGRRLWWCDGRGFTRAGAPPMLDTSEPMGANGVIVPARWIDVVLPRVGTRSPVLLFFKVAFSSADVEVTIRVKAQCDELPDDLFEVAEDFVLKIHDRLPPYELRARP